MSLLAGLGNFPAASSRAWLSWESSGSREQAETKVPAHWWENKYPFQAFSKEAQTNAASIAFKRCFQPGVLQLPPAEENL